MSKREFDKLNDGLCYKDNTWMIGGYISDILKDSSKEFEDRTGYVDDNGKVNIYFKEPRKSDIIPWFTTKEENGELTLEFNPYTSDEIESEFNIDKIQNMSVTNIMKESKGIDTLYDEDMMNDMMTASSKYVPEIKEADDFLKKLVKTVLLEKDVDAHRYKTVVDKPYIISNLIQALQGTTKTNPPTFSQWMGLTSCNFKIIVEDNGTDPKFPLKQKIIYDSATNRIMKENENDEKESYCKSVKQFTD